MVSIRHGGKQKKHREVVFFSLFRTIHTIVTFPYKLYIYAVKQCHIMTYNVHNSQGDQDTCTLKGIISARLCINIDLQIMIN